VDKLPRLARVRHRLRKAEEMLQSILGMVDSLNRWEHLEVCQMRLHLQRIGRRVDREVRKLKGGVGE